MITPLPGPGWAPFSLEVLQVVIIVQITSLCLCGPFWSRRNPRPANLRTTTSNNATVVVSALLPAWPLVALLGLASGVSLMSLATIEGFAAAVGVVVINTASFAEKTAVTAEARQLIRSSIGATAAFCVWLLRNSWLSWVSP